MLRPAILRLGQAGMLAARGPLRSQVRHANIEFPYRGLITASKGLHRRADALMGFFWFWILWHTWHTPEDILGHFPWPKTEEWTDEELGIPPLDEDD
ncbi:PREDICTED: NADH dehydrogenase [ubiquinone] 1 beta subcomplex subunit 2, mitochondrial-like [Branchiostoma belcheri]|uniref:NADH dehydrogenase [ubiquinone] 1 beta subcomplex subunit 2, mitochondrial n=1 Tax=Branchiostoma belcheri TaxID=7741 RepID=A0A6P4YQL9_BRABE|nr:PREDICTED: NADH dehydrogenase [ubiquinone] 1 beta subcomplex subunit 2, mitochondrial-like [Branchiostoma belcheri]